MYINYLDLNLILKISHYIHASIPRSKKYKTQNLSGPKHFGPIISKNTAVSAYFDLQVTANKQME